ASVAVVGRFLFLLFRLCGRFLRGPLPLELLRLLLLPLQFLLALHESVIRSSRHAVPSSRFGQLVLRGVPRGDSTGPECTGYCAARPTFPFMSTTAFDRVKCSRICTGPRIAAASR